MRVLVTGGAGFIGSHLCDLLLADNHTVLVFDNLVSGKIENLPSGVEFYQESIVDESKVREVMSKFQPDVIAHLAAQKSVSYSVKDPVYDARENIIGSLNLFEVAREMGTKKIVFASTGGALYGETEELPTSEPHQTYPESPYGVAKLAVERYIHYYAKVHGLPASTLRLANVYGPRQDPAGEAGVVAIFCSKLVEDKPVTIFGDGEQTRDYVYCVDVAEAFVRAIGHADPVTLNVGTSVETSVNQLADGIGEAAGKPIDKRYEPARAGELFRSSLNWSAAQKTLGWSPKTDLAAGLGSTYQFFAERG